MFSKCTLLGSAMLLAACAANAQSIIPSNFDFELGTTVGWTYYRGAVASGHIFSLSSCSPATGLHEITSGSGTDAYGGFPVVGVGSHSLKLSHDTISNNADGASYNVAIPAGTTSYDLVYHYALVLQDAAHTVADLPEFELAAIDSNTGMAIATAPVEINSGFSGMTPSSSGMGIKYLPWTSASLDLTGHEGHTVIFKFMVAACGTAGHFGYAYIDVSGCFERAYDLAPLATTSPLHGPAGYASYRWTDSATYTASLGTTASISISAPVVTTTYALIVTPIAGHGTVDTFYTTIRVNPSLGSGTVASRSLIQVYPNPTRGMASIQWTGLTTGTADVEVKDVAGHVVRTTMLSIAGASGQGNVDLTSLADGTYFISIRTGDIEQTTKVVLQK